MGAIWRQECAEGSRRLRVATLNKLEGVKSILDTHLATALSTLDEEEREVAVKCFKYLVTPSLGKIALTAAELSGWTYDSEESVTNVLGKLDVERIVRTVEAAPGRDETRDRRFEIFHDVLADAIRKVTSAHEKEGLAREAERRLRRTRELQ